MAGTNIEQAPSTFAQAEIVVIPIIDTSGSMQGEKIGQVNEAMSEVPGQLAEINDDNIDSKLLIAPMEFSTGARWFALKNGEPAEADVFRWIDMQASGLTDLGAACDLLYQKLTVTENGGWMKGRGGVAPIIILISDGAPTDDWQSGLKKLKTRGWFNAAVKFAVAVGADADKEVLKAFTGNIETVIDTEMIRNSLSAIIKKVVVTASKTVSRTVSGTNSGNTINVVEESTEDANQEMKNNVAEEVTNEINMDDTDDMFGDM